MVDLTGLNRIATPDERAYAPSATEQLYAGGLARGLPTPWQFPLLFAAQRQGADARDQYISSLSEANAQQREIDATRMASEERRAAWERAASLFQHGVPITNLMSALHGILSGDGRQLAAVDTIRQQRAIADTMKAYGEAANQGAQGGVRFNTPGMVQNLSQIAGAPLGIGPTEVDARMAAAANSGQPQYTYTMRPPPGLNGVESVQVRTRNPDAGAVQQTVDTASQMVPAGGNQQGARASTVQPQGGTTNPNQMTPNQVRNLNELARRAQQQNMTLGPRQSNADGSVSLSIEQNGRRIGVYRMTPDGATTRVQ